MHLYYHYQLKAGFELIQKGVQKDAEGHPLDPIVFYHYIGSRVYSGLLPHKLPLNNSLLINIHGANLKHSVSGWEMVLQSCTYSNSICIEEAKRMLQLNTQVTMRDKKLTAMTFAVLHWPSGQTYGCKTSLVVYITHHQKTWS
jgi:hypothetical protein